jgi:hypothetical protein
LRAHGSLGGKGADAHFFSRDAILTFGDEQNDGRRAKWAHCSLGSAATRAEAIIVALFRLVLAVVNARRQIF